ncbi:MAG TPA: HPP family protein [Telluria sp.]|nr:HPP family protein [Telluria sp.]
MARKWLRRFLPPPNTASRSEQLRGAAGALAGLLLTGALMAHAAPGAAWLIAPMGASAVLLFGLPASPLAQPWSILAGNVCAALVGVTCARFVDVTLLAAALAVALSIGAMFALRCLHPPSGAVALTAVLGGPAVQAAGYAFILTPVLSNSLLLVAAALLYNNATGRRYPHLQHPVLSNIHDTRDKAPTERLGFTAEDLDDVLRRYGQVLDVSRDDLEALFLQTEAHAYARRFGLITCRDIMSADVVTVEPSASLEEAWTHMRDHQVHSLPVLDGARRVVGIVALSDLLRGSALDSYATLGARLKAALRSGRHTVASIMSRPVHTARADMPMVELIPLMANAGFHHIPVLERDGRFAGMVTQSDVVAGLYESRLGMVSPANGTTG